MTAEKKFGLMEEKEISWNVKEEKVTSVSSAWTYIGLAYIAATLA